MPFTVLFAFLTAPFIIGVAVTIAVPQYNTRENAPLVYVLAVVWGVLAYRLKTRLADRFADRWVGKWFALAVALPLLVEFAVSLSFDGEFVALWKQFQAENAARATPDAARASPGHHSFTPAQLRDLLAAVQPRAKRFVVQLFESLPGKWWLLAFVLAAVKGK